MQHKKSQTFFIKTGLDFVIGKCIDIQGYRHTTTKTHADRHTETYKCSHGHTHTHTHTCAHTRTHTLTAVYFPSIVQESLNSSA